MNDDLGPDDVQVGDIVTSRWSSNGAHWQVTGLGERRQAYGGRWYRRLEVRSVKQGRKDTKTTNEVRIVPAAEVDTRLVPLSVEDRTLIAWALNNVKGWPQGLDPDQTMAVLHGRSALAARIAPDQNEDRA